MRRPLLRHATQAPLLCLDALPAWRVQHGNAPNDESASNAIQCVVQGRKRGCGAALRRGEVWRNVCEAGCAYGCVWLSSPLIC